jgi:spermidine synthase
VQQVTLVELDAHMTRLFAENPLLVQLNAGALNDPRVRIVNADAYTWLEGQREVFDLIVIDFPDPTNFALGKLYTTSFYQRADQALAAGGYMVVQTTSPLIARQSFWTVASTIEAVGLATTPYCTCMCRALANGVSSLPAAGPGAMPKALPEGLRFLTPAGLPALLQFPPDMARVPAEVNRLSNQVLVHTFEDEWGRVQ